jgi:predicted nucleic acid-binding protein
MSARILVDTNVLIYAYDRADPVKEHRALAVLDELASSGAGALTTQVLGEFLVNVTRKPAIPLPLEGALDEVARYLRTWHILDVTSRVVEEAIRGVRAYRLNYWDAQIWAAARVYGLSTIYSEDFTAGASLEGVRFVNPFKSPRSTAPAPSP